MSVADSHRAGRVVRTGLAFAWLVATASACGSINSASDGGTGTGGSNATGAAGSTGAAGTTGAGGTTGVAGAIGSGGSTGSAGRTGAAGSAGTGNAGRGGTGGTTGAAGRGGTTGGVGGTGGGRFPCQTDADCSLFRCCNGVCVNTNNDILNCGGCNKPCAGPASVLRAAPAARRPAPGHACTAARCAAAAVLRAGKLCCFLEVGPGRLQCSDPVLGTLSPGLHRRLPLRRAHDAGRDARGTRAIADLRARRSASTASCTAARSRWFRSSSFTARRSRRRTRWSS